ncbi:MAG: family 16 glycosylhydrolase [Marinifilaceae bacterium]
MGIARKINKSLNAEAIDKNRMHLDQDLKEVKSFLKTEDFNKFKELDVLVKSKCFLKNRKKIKSLSYKKSELRQDEKLYKKLSSNKKIKVYFKVLESVDFKEFKNSCTGEKVDVVSKFKNSKEYKIFKEIENSQILKEYIDCKTKVESADFIKERDFLLNKNRYETTEDFYLLEKYESYMEQSVVKNYLQYKDSAVLETFNNWKIIFDDSFAGGQLDDSKWSCVANSVPSLVKSNFSVENDKYFFTAGNNISIDNNALNISTKKAKIEGVLLDTKVGFRKTSFDYSSGVITTQGLFSQKFGKFEAKIKFDNMAANHTFWLAGEKRTPHIDIIKVMEKKKSLCSLIMSQQNIACEKINKLDLSNDYFIYTLVWTADKIEWKINEVTVWKQTKNIPTEPMSLFFASPVYNDLSSDTKMSIAWVKVYEETQE